MFILKVNNKRFSVIKKKGKRKPLGISEKRWNVLWKYQIKLLNIFKSFPTFLTISLPRQILPFLSLEEKKHCPPGTSANAFTSWLILSWIQVYTLNNSKKILMFISINLTDYSTNSKYYLFLWLTAAPWILTKSQHWFSKYALKGQVACWSWTARCQNILRSERIYILKCRWQILVTTLYFGHCTSCPNSQQFLGIWTVTTYVKLTIKNTVGLCPM